MWSICHPSLRRGASAGRAGKWRREKQRVWNSREIRGECMFIVDTKWWDRVTHCGCQAPPPSGWNPELPKLLASPMQTDIPPGPGRLPSEELRFMPLFAWNLSLVLVSKRLWWSLCLLDPLHNPETHLECRLIHGKACSHLLEDQSTSTAWLLQKTLFT